MIDGAGYLIPVGYAVRPQTGLFFVGIKLERNKKER
ncbi:MAG: hypothetical protein A4E63_01402 [Syntrophorhabdus sp. PtaU1.Bin050]|nr:MAG: hypothetical protein A4E63_01402 [Syntrophorhabdus sp. PtaU1.Bin050]